MWARRQAAEWLSLPQFYEQRWPHVVAVSRKAERLGPAFSVDEAALLAAAGWLHDLGYSPELAVTGFHHLDGANALVARGACRRLSALVANHSSGALEAPMRGLEAEMAAYQDEASPVRDALWTCDMTTSPTGEPIDFEDRLRDIVHRYGPGHSVSRSITAGAYEIRAAIERTRQRARAAGLAVDF